MRGWVVLLWAALATVVLIVVGIFGTLLASGRIELVPTPTPTATPIPEVTPVIDQTYDVMILNATPEQGLATQMKDVVVAAELHGHRSTSQSWSAVRPRSSRVSSSRASFS